MTAPCRPRELRPRARRVERQNAHRLVEAVAARTQVPIGEIINPPPRLRRDRFQVRAVAAWLIRHVDHLPYGEIAMVVGVSGHSHARYLVARGDELRASDLVIRALTDSIMGEHA